MKSKLHGKVQCIVEGKKNGSLTENGINSLSVDVHNEQCKRQAE